MTTPPTPPSSDWYVTGIVVSHVMHAAAMIGVDLRADLEASGLLRPTDYELMSRVPGERWERVLMTLLLASEDPLFGFHVGQPLLIARYGLLVHALLSRATIEDALNLLSRFYLVGVESLTIV